MASSPFLNQVRRVIRLKHMSLSTEDSYLYYIKQFILFHDKRHPKDMGFENPCLFVLLCIGEAGFRLNQEGALSTSLFLYGTILKT